MPVHLGRPRLRAGARLDPGVPQEARLDLDHARASASTRPANPGLRAGATYGGTCAAYERRVAEGTVTLERISESGPTHNDPPIVNVRHFAAARRRLARRPAVHELVRARSRDRADVRDLGGLGNAGAVRRVARGAHRAGAGPDGQRVSASRSPTRSTTRLESCAAELSTYAAVAVAAVFLRGSRSRASASRRTTSSEGNESRAASVSST